MRTTVFLAMLAVAVIVATPVLSTGNIKQDDPLTKREKKREYRERKKELKSWNPDPLIGSARFQINVLVNHQLAKTDGGNAKYVVEAIQAHSGDKTIAITKARNICRAEGGKNAGNHFSGKTEGGETFENYSGEDISDELQEATIVFDEVFAEELSRNRVIARFFKKEGKIYWVMLAISWDMQQLENDIKKLTKQELRDRIAKVRQKHDETQKKSGGY